MIRVEDEMNLGEFIDMLRRQQAAGTVVTADEFGELTINDTAMEQILKEDPIAAAARQVLKPTLWERVKRFFGRT